MDIWLGSKYAYLLYNKITESEGLDTSDITDIGKSHFLIPPPE